MNEFAIIGAGAVAQSRYIPALEESPHASVEWVVDVDEDRARAVANEAGASASATAYEEALPEVDAAVVATPPRFHEAIARDCLEAGVHLLSEKPVALSSQRASAVAALAEEHDVHFAICRQYREAPACRLLKSFSETLGSIHTVDAVFGDGTHWDFASEYRVDAQLAGGGVLADKGPHLIDVVLWILDERIRVDRYRDDNLGRMEANAEIAFSVPERGLSGTMEISASRDLTNRIELVGENGRMTADPGGTEATVVSDDMDEPTRLTTDEEAPPRTSAERMTRQVHRFVESLETDTVSYVPAETDARVLEVIESCYSNRERLPRPWEEKHLTLADGGS